MILVTKFLICSKLRQNLFQVIGMMLSREQLPSWQRLANKALCTKDLNITGKVSFSNITLDYSAENIDDEVLQYLSSLAAEAGVAEYREKLFSGAIINLSEQRPALHTALRAPAHHKILLGKENIMPSIVMTRNKMQAIAQSLRSKTYVGGAGIVITDVVNVGIGGSDLGLKFCFEALGDYVISELNFHFLSDPDLEAFDNLVNHLNKDTTLFIIASKSFATYETLYNTKKVVAWLGDNNLNSQVIAVTANPDKARALGIHNILEIWPWVGGRYSLCSAINLITCIAIGYENFTEFLNGAHAMDQHFYNAKLINNLPVILATLGIWNINFLKINNLLYLLYSSKLAAFIPYLQQLDMESNGKTKNQHGEKLNYATSPIIWGGLGAQVQHSYYQLISQGSQKIAAELISVKKNIADPVSHLCSAHQQNLEHILPFVHIQIEALTPETLGSLVALYEHKIFVQAVIWGINPFDQPGVETAKILALQVAEENVI
jgi:glucose-6-phosphate isomerase